MRGARLWPAKCCRRGFFGAKSAKSAVEISLRGEML
jgi:hypothetical protein